MSRYYVLLAVAAFKRLVSRVDWVMNVALMLAAVIVLFNPELAQHMMRAFGRATGKRVPILPLPVLTPAPFLVLARPRHGSACQRRTTADRGVAPRPHRGRRADPPTDPPATPLLRSGHPRGAGGGANTGRAGTVDGGCAGVSRVACRCGFLLQAYEQFSLIRRSSRGHVCGNRVDWWRRRVARVRLAVASSGGD